MRLAIIGLGPEPQALFKADQIWAINDWWSIRPSLHPDRGVQIHPGLPEDPMPGSGRWRGWLHRYRALGKAAIVGAPDPRLPEATIADVAGLDSRHGSEAVSSSAAAAILIAAETLPGLRSVELLGCPLSIPEERARQAWGIEYALAHLESRGIHAAWSHRHECRGILPVNWRAVWNFKPYWMP